MCQNLSFWRRFTGHLTTILIHKFWVAFYCFHAGLFWQGIVHDMSKFSPVEFFEGVRYYTGDGTSPINVCKRINGYSYAWFHHRGRNYHHYEMWQDDFDHGGKSVMMPYKYVVELVCDYLAAGKAYNGSKFSYEQEYDWWVKKRSNGIAMHPKTQLFVEEILYQLKVKKDLSVISVDNTKRVYITYCY